MAQIKTLSDLTRKRGAPKKDPKKKRNNIISFRLVDSHYKKLTNNAKPLTPHEGARKIVEDKLSK